MVQSAEDRQRENATYRLDRPVPTANPIRLACASELGDERRVLELFNLLRWMLLDLFRSRSSLEGEIIALRHQLNVLRRSAPKRPALTSFDRFILVLLYRLAPTVLDAMTIVRPETIMRWHRAGFRSFWRWKSWRRPGRPKVALEVRQLIREMSLANPFWGAPRIHGELLKLGIDVGQTSVAKYMARRRRPPSQGWRTFLLNHADGIASIDLFVVPTISFKLLYGLLILRHDRRRIVWVSVTTSPTSQWIARQVREACGGSRCRITSFVIATVSMARHLRAASERWAFATDRQRRDRHGRTAMPND